MVSFTIRQSTPRHLDPALSSTNQMPILCLKADITSINVDAIVNSANPALIAGGGVCGAIHRVAGPELEKVCREIGKCEVGSAVITPAFNLRR